MCNVVLDSHVQRSECYTCFFRLFFFMWFQDIEYSSLCLSAFSRVQLCATPWTVARQAPLSMGFSRREYWRGLPCPPPGHLPNPRIEPTSPECPALQADSAVQFQVLCGKSLLLIYFMYSSVNLYSNTPNSSLSCSFSTLLATGLFSVSLFLLYI